MENAYTVLVDDKSHRVAIPGQLEVLDIPMNVAGEVGVLFGSQIDERQSLKLRAAIGCRIDPSTIPAETRVGVQNLFRGLGREAGLLAGSQIQQPKMAFV